MGAGAAHGRGRTSSASAPRECLVTASHEAQAILEKLPMRKESLGRGLWRNWCVLGATVIASLTIASFLPSAVALAADPNGTLAAALHELPGQPVPALPGQSVTLLPDGRWLLVGGTGQAGVVATVALDDATGIVESTLVLAHARTGHTATVLPDGTVLVFGGTGPDGKLLTGAERIDPIRGTVMEIATPDLTSRTAHSA